ncbi:Glucose-6-phosphate isomerase [Delftia tsuruhatensis]|uniref:glucose-6-phosphate isomerase n=1 Tax=Delftia tsuruhatensis TaxID=180282 RepID=UPI001E73A938|nr:glucose-6-phosphate isomerase [Delftia tsuruhatensis]CAB5664590.1 Glucose-6-phosphate isomerase [Delftia tsuruhatensis]CAC9677438.1 Glucose-6-phosphate isomerase [Delftia tsuruhatensis]
MVSVLPLPLRCDQTSAWPALHQHADGLRQCFDLRHAFAEDPGRFARFSQEAPHCFADLSKNLWDAQAEGLLLRLARECGVERQRDAMFGGEHINGSEGRAVLHTLLRSPRGEAPPGLAWALDQVHETLDAMLAHAERVRADADITDVVCLGIGGSGLGPQMAVQALQGLCDGQRRMHFVSNVDGHALQPVLGRVRPRNTLFIVASKVFNTQETLANARSALEWFRAQGSGEEVSRHFVALTTNAPAAAQMGITTTFGFWDWVGGRYSLWSAIGLPVAIAVGAQAFRALLAGAHAMDTHFRQAPLQANLPVRLGLLDVWNRNLLGFASRCIAPYHAGLRRLPAYLQQLEMESNGKRVDRQGRPLAQGSAPVLWGEPGTDGQHAFFQMLHQGSDIVPLEIIAVRRPSHGLPGHHEQLLANALAQAQALMQGRSCEDGHRHFPGNRPSTFMLLEALTPAALGALIALQEHRVFVAGALWGINSFDQWGVELGKLLARDLQPRLASGNVAGLDASTAGLLQRLRA